MTTEWYFARTDKNVQGPVEFNHLQELASSGDLLPSDLVWHDRIPDWVAAETIKGLSFSEVSDRAASAQNDEPQRMSPKLEIVLGVSVNAVLFLFLGKMTLIGWLGWESVFQIVYMTLLIGAAIVACTTLVAKRHLVVLMKPEQVEGVGIGASIVCGMALWCLLGFWRGLLLLICAAGAFLTYLVASAAKTKRPEEMPWLWWAGSAITGLVTLVLLYFGVLKAPAYPGIPVKRISDASVVLTGSWTELDLPVSESEFAWHGTAFVYEREGESLKLYTNSHCLGLQNLAECAGEQPNRTANIGHYQLTVTFPSGKSKPVVRVGETSDIEWDVARLEVSAEGLVEGKDYVVVPVVENCIEDLNVQVGDEVIALGTPCDPELAGTQTFGRVGAFRVPKGKSEGPVWIQHDATMTGGNSGGPLFLKRGKLAHWIGINTRGLFSTSIGFAISANEVVIADYQWADADADGAAELVRTVYEIPAVVGKGTSGWPNVALLPRTDSPRFDPDKTESVSRPTFANSRKPLDLLARCARGEFGMMGGIIVFFAIIAFSKLVWGK